MSVICTVSTIKDSLTNVSRFVERNLAAGADHLFVFLEGGDRETLAHLGEHPHVTVVDVDAVSRSHRQAAGLNARQTINANRINCLLADVDSVQWLFHIDGDEVLDIDRERLLALEPDVTTVRLVPRESVSSATSEGTQYFKRLLTREELSLLTVLGLIDRPNNRRYFHGHVAGKVGIRPSLSFGMHIHQARVLGEPDPQEGFRADWLRLLHYESFTMEEFLRKWTAHLGAGPDTKFRGEKDLVRGAVRAVLDNPSLAEDGKRRYLVEIYQRRLEDDVQTLRELGLLETAGEGTHRPVTFSRRDTRRLAQELPALLEADLDYFLPSKVEREPAELMERTRRRSPLSRVVG